jgi:hypothetical protein
VLDKEHASDRTGIFMIDASKGFMKDGNKNRLRAPLTSGVCPYLMCVRIH